MTEPISAYTASIIASLLFKLGLMLVGYLITRMGFRLLERGITGEFKFSANISGTKADLASVSPGVLFAVIGLAIIGLGIFQQNPFASLSVERTGVPVSAAHPSDGQVPDLPVSPPGMKKEN